MTTTYFRKKDITAYIILLFICMYLFKDILFGGKLLFGSDFAAFYLGLKQFIYDEVHNYGSIPFWNPFVFGGMPFWAHFESTIFYPLNILFWIMLPERAYGYTMFIHMVLAGGFMYILARSFYISRPGSLAAAFVFMLNGFVMATLFDGQMFRVQAYIWIPLIIFFLNRALHSSNCYTHAFSAGLFWGIQLLSGAPQDAFYTFLLAVIFLAWNTKYDSRGFLKLTGIIFSMAIIGAGIGAIQLIPSFEYISRSVRAVFHGNYELLTLGSYPLEGIITIIMPHFFGNYAKANFWVSNVPWSVPLYNLYVGIIPVILLFFIAYRSPEKKRFLYFALSAAVLAFILALGSNTFVYKAISLLPGFDKIRAPAKIIIIWAFALSLLSGKGMDDLFRHGKNISFIISLLLFFITLFLLLDIVFHLDRSIILTLFSPFFPEAVITQKLGNAAELISGEFHRFTLISLFTVLIILLWNRGFLNYTPAVAILCLFLLMDLGYANNGAIREGTSFYAALKEKKTGLGESIGKDRSIYRVGSYRSGMSPNMEMYLGYQTICGYNPLFLQRYYEYINKYMFANEEINEGWILFYYRENENSRLMDLLNVKYVISHDTGQFTFRSSYLSRLFLVPEIKAVNKEEVLDKLVSPEFNPEKTILVETGNLILDKKINNNFELTPDDQAGIISYRPDEIIISTQSNVPAYLFLSEIYYPGWKAYLDDSEVEIYRGNYLFRVIKVPEGKHTVRMVFSPLSIKLGVLITLITLLVLMCIYFYYFRDRLPFTRHIKLK